MENLQQIEKFIDVLIAQTKAKLNDLQEIKLILNRDTLRTGNVSTTTELKQTLNSLTIETDKNYKAIRNWSGRLSYMLKGENRAINKSHFMTLIEKYEGPRIAKKQATAIYSNLNEFVGSGLAIRGKFNGDKRLSFYFKSEWLDDSAEVRTIKPEHFPAEELLNGATEDELRPEKIKWSDKEDKSDI